MAAVDEIQANCLMIAIGKQHGKDAPHHDGTLYAIIVSGLHFCVIRLPKNMQFATDEWRGKHLSMESYT